MNKNTVARVLSDHLVLTETNEYWECLCGAKREVDRENKVCLLEAMQWRLDHLVDAIVDGIELDGMGDVEREIHKIALACRSWKAKYEKSRLESDKEMYKVYASITTRLWDAYDKEKRLEKSSNLPGWVWEILIDVVGHGDYKDLIPPDTFETAKVLSSLKESFGG